MDTAQQSNLGAPRLASETWDAASTEKNMPAENYPERRRSSLPALLLGVLLGMVLFAAFAHEARTGVWNHLADVISWGSL